MAGFYALVFSIDQLHDGGFTEDEDKFRQMESGITSNKKLQFLGL